MISCSWWLCNIAASAWRTGNLVMYHVNTKKWSRIVIWIATTGLEPPKPAKRIIFTLPGESWKQSLNSKYQMKQKITSSLILPHLLEIIWIKNQVKFFCSGTTDDIWPTQAVMLNNVIETFIFMMVILMILIIIIIILVMFMMSSLDLQ